MYFAEKNLLLCYAKESLHHNPWTVAIHSKTLLIWKTIKAVIQCKENTCKWKEKETTNRVQQDKTKQWLSFNEWNVEVIRSTKL